MRVRRIQKLLGAALLMAASVVGAPASAQTLYGLEWPGDGAVRRMLYWSNPFPIYDATYIFKVYPRKKTSGTYRYYTTFFWGNNGTFYWDGGTWNTYYGAHPYPMPPPSGPGQWECACADDVTTGTEVEWDRWHTQAFRAWRESPSVTHHEFYYDLPDTSKVIAVTINNAAWADTNPPFPAIMMGQAPDNGGGQSWGGYPGWEEFNGVLRGVQIYSGLLSLADIQTEVASPKSTAAGQALIWYLNLDPRPSDVNDKKAIGTPHNPSWEGVTALEWNSQAPPPDSTPPTTPTGLTATAVSSSQINLAWTASTDDVGVTGYRVYRDGVQAATAAGTSHQDVGLSPATTYTYTVAAVDAAGNLSAPSNAASAMTLSGPVQGLLAAYGFSEGAGSTTFDASGNGHTGLLVGATWTGAGKYGSGIAFASTTQRVDLGTVLDIGTLPFTLEAWVYPTSRADWRSMISKRSSWSAPGMRFDLGTEITSGRVYLGQPNNFLQSNYVPPLNAWTHLAVVADTAATRFYANGVLQQTLGAFALGTGATAPVYVGNNGDLDDPFAGQIDEVRLYSRALSQAEIQADMNAPIGSSADTAPPTAPTNLVATAASSSQVDLTWAAATDNVGVASYQVERCQGSGCGAFTLAAMVTGTSYSDTGLLAATSYSYRVRAVDGSGNAGPYSATATAITQAAGDLTPPTVPGSLAAVISVSLSWTAATDNVGVTGYRVYRNGVLLATKTAIQLSHVDAAAPPGATYTVTAIDAAGNESAVAGPVP